MNTVNPSERFRFTAELQQCAADLARDGSDALGRMYDLTATRLLRYALSLTRNQDDAEDVVQAAMVKVALKPRVLASAKFPWAYFLKIVRNEGLDLIQKRQASQGADYLLEGWVAPSRDYEDFEVRQSIRAALDKLPPAQSEVVLLKIWENMTFVEIGEVLGESANTAASRYRYAIGKLSHPLRQVFEDVLYER